MSSYRALDLKDENRRLKGHLAARKNEPIAIVGMSGVLPKSKDLGAYWDNLLEGNNCVSRVPGKRTVGDSRWSDPELVAWGGFIDDLDLFDPQFFGISPREAEFMDPQQRIFLECAWKTIEDAGYSRSAITGKNIGVFAGVSTWDYSARIRRSGVRPDYYTSIGMAHCMIPNRISHVFDFHGPSEAVTTACSSSLVAIGRAVDALRGGICEAAIAGGVNAIIEPAALLASRAMLSADGCCKTFDESANGMVRGEGVGTVYLKRLSDAERDGDNIYALILGSGCNHGGMARTITAPNPDAQSQLLIDTYKNLGIDPASISYIEAHGTGTKLGDPIEIEGLKKAFSHLYEAVGRTMPSQPHCGIGTAKVNVGHLEAAAGMAGLFKVVLSMQSGLLPGNIHLKQQNSKIDLSGTPFYLIKDREDWHALKDEFGTALPRRAGINSFGFGGTNAHLVVEEYRPRSLKTDDRCIAKGGVFVLSAKNTEALKEYAQSMLGFIHRRSKSLAEDASFLPRLLYTLQVGREPMSQRLAFIVDGWQDLECSLDEFLRSGRLGDRGFVGTAVVQSDLPNDWPTWRLDDISRAWTMGGTIDWCRLYTDSMPIRIPLPTYPFARCSYWVECPDLTAVPLANIASAATNHGPMPVSEPPVAPNSSNTKLEDSLASLMGQVLKIDAGLISMTENPANYGVDSVNWLEFLDLVERELGAHIDLSEIQDSSNSIRCMASRMSEKVGMQKSPVPNGSSDRLQSHIRGRVAEVLKLEGASVDALDVKNSLAGYGVDSVNWLEFIDLLSKDFCVDIDLDELSGPSVGLADLVSELTTKYPEEISAWSSNLEAPLDGEDVMPGNGDISAFVDGLSIEEIEELFESAKNDHTHSGSEIA